VTATEAHVDTSPQCSPVGHDGPGSRLKSAREAAGLSLDQVAQQLKLAPRQVRALEDEDFAQLPGRTFARGFVRNYARLMNLDGDDLLSMLPDAAHAPALEAPALQPTGAMIAELPTRSAPKTNFTRWLIPLVLVACIVGAAAYEWYRGGMSNPSEAARTSSEVSEKTALPAVPAQSVIALPNPFANEGKPAAEASSATVAADTAAAAASALPVAAASAEAPLVLSFQGPSWAEIRDSRGQLLVSRLVGADSVEQVRGAPPFDIVLGNARVVTVVYLGKPLDLGPYTRRNVARLTVK
jgi:cytoskeleton protein RodZ